MVCPHPQECEVDCQFNNAVVRRTVKPYPAVPDDMHDPMEDWMSMDDLIIAAIWVAVAAVVGLMSVSLVSFIALLI